MPGPRLPANLAEATGLTADDRALHCTRAAEPARHGHDPGRTATDLAVMLANGGEAKADLAMLRNQF